MSLPPPIRPLACVNPDCSFPSGGRCARAAELGDPAAECPDLSRSESQEFTDDPAPAPQPEAPRTPWTGAHLDTSEAERLGWQAPLHRIAVLGAQRSGKTCLLTSFFLQLANGQRGPFAYRFAGSRSLHGLNTLCERAARWEGAGEIVEYTKLSESDAPRQFLHLAVRPEEPRDDRVLNLLLSDLPGEWVGDWATHQDERASRRLAFLDRSEALAVLVDAEALLDPKGGTLDNATNLLLRRLMDRLGERRPPIALMFTKFDRVVQQFMPPGEGANERTDWGPLGAKPRLWNAVRAMRERGFVVRPFAVSAFPGPLSQGQPVGVMAPFAWMMGHIDRREPRTRPPTPVPSPTSSFCAMRREAR